MMLPGRLTTLALLLTVGLAACAAPPRPPDTAEELPEGRQVAEEAAQAARAAEQDELVLYGSSIPAETEAPGEAEPAGAGRDEAPEAPGDATVQLTVAAPGELAVGDEAEFDLTRLREVLEARLPDVAAPKLLIAVAPGADDPDFIAEILAEARQAGFTRFEFVPPVVATPEAAQGPDVPAQEVVEPAPDDAEADAPADPDEAAEIGDDEE